MEGYKKQNTGKTTLMITAIILISKLFGFLREMLMAAYFGAGVESDAYSMAYGIFYTVVMIFTSCVSSTFIPQYSKEYMNRGEKAANRYTNNILHLFGIIAIVVSILCVIFSPAIIRVVAMGYGAEQLSLTITLSQIIFPALLFYVMAVIFSALLNAREKFIAPQLMGFAISLGVLGCVIPLSGRFGILSAGYGTVLAGILQVLILVPFLKGQYKYQATMDVKDESVKQSLKLAVPALIGMTVTELNYLIDKALASGLVEGSVTALGFAYKLVTFVIGVFVVPIVTILFSKLSELSAKGDRQGIKDGVKQSMEMISLIILPITVIAMVMSHEVIRVVYERGNFDAAASLLTNSAFVFYIIGFIGYGLREVFTRAFYSLEDTKTPMLVGVFSIAVNVVLNIVLVRFMAIGGLAFASSISAILGAMLLLINLRKKLGKMGMKSTIWQMVMITAASLVSGFATYLVKANLSIQSTFLSLIVCAGVGLIVYIVLVLAMGVKEARTLVGEFTSRIKR